MRIKSLRSQTIASVMLFFSLIFITGTAQANEKSEFIQKFSIKMSTGLSYLTVGDINTHLESGNARHLDEAQYFNGSRHGELKKIGYGSDSDIELRFDIMNRFGIYFSLGYVYARRESSSGFEVTPPGFYDVDFTFSPRISIRTIPLRLGIYYIIPLISKMKLFINGGVGYYFSKTNYYFEEREIWTRIDGSLFADITEMVEWDLNSGTIGYHGGIGFEYAVAKNLDLVFEVQGKSATTKELEGMELFVGSGQSESLHGSVYYYEKKSPATEKYYVGLGFYGEKPDYLPSPEYRDIKYAKLNLGGYSLKIGIRVRLF